VLLSNFFPFFPLSSFFTFLLFSPLLLIRYFPFTSAVFAQVGCLSVGVGCVCLSGLLLSGDLEIS
jgi:hypothetical protein